jgi:hypothetical protein
MKAFLAAMLRGGPSRPAPRLDGSDLWAQGVDLGAVLSF